MEERELVVRSRWFSGAARVTTYHLDELLGTKLRALYQRKKGRDLFDLHLASRRQKVDPERVVECFRRYLEHEGTRVSRAEMEMNLHEKLADPAFISDIAPLIAPDVEWDLAAAADYVRRELVARLPGEPWQGGLVNPLESTPGRKS
jgi:predicted nucleotidyltransferase component of viral defense system